MILSFSGDPFLATRAARRALRAQGLSASEIVELGEGMEPRDVAQQGAQGGLFGRVGLLLDFDAAFQGKGGVQPRNQALEVLATLPRDTVVAVIDLIATPARQKRYRELGEHEHLPTPRFGALVAWVRAELQAAGLSFERDVPETLADLFGEDLPAISGEISKLASLDENLSGGRVREIAGRLAARDAFDLIDACASGDPGEALAVCQALMLQGESPVRVLAALNWQYDVVARCVALLQSRGRLRESELATALKVKPFVARKSLAIASQLDETALRRALKAILAADRAMKGGGDETWALESLALELSEQFSPAGS